MLFCSSSDSLVSNSVSADAWLDEFVNWKSASFGMKFVMYSKPCVTSNGNSMWMRPVFSVDMNLRVVV